MPQVHTVQAIESEAKVINLNPSIAWKLSEELSIGAGLNVQRMEATLSNRISPLAPDSLAKIEASGYGWGYNLGLLWQPGKDTRIGLAWRSGVEHTLDTVRTAFGREAVAAAARRRYGAGTRELLDNQFNDAAIIGHGVLSSARILARRRMYRASRIGVASQTSTMALASSGDTSVAPRVPSSAVRWRWDRRTW